jgi:parallel beta-helix repeat protein/predicted outer membrane repeat protein
VVVGSGVDNTAVLDGFTITGGNANGSAWYGRGGGMYAYEGYPSVSNCKFILNRAEDGGGVCTYESSTSDSPVSMTLENCIIAGNSAQDNGGGMYIYMSNPVLTGCQFTDNTADSGGGIYGNLSTIGDGCTLTSCTFSENSAVTSGGGIYNYAGGTTTTNCRFLGNQAGDSGGGIYNYMSDANIINCTFINNSSDTACGAILNLSNTAIISNCLFSCNTSDSIGGLGGSASTSEVTNCTISNNTATWIAGGVGQQDGSIDMANSILWGNSDSYGGEGSQIFISSATTEVKYCCIEDINSLAGLGNIDTDPCFMDTGHPDPNLWNLRLKPDSACIDAADTTAVTGLLDLDANPRIIDAPYIPNTGQSLLDSLHVVDMGAYEFFCAGLYGDINCDGVVDFRDLAILCGNWLARIP